MTRRCAKRNHYEDFHVSGPGPVGDAAAAAAALTDVRSTVERLRVDIRRGVCAPDENAPLFARTIDTTIAAMENVRSWLVGPRGGRNEL